jgi:replication factor C large subunit
MNARSIMQNIDETPDHKMLWIDENIPYALRDKGDLTRGYEKLARADIFLGRVRRRQYYRFWAYAGDIMSAGVNVSIRSAPGPYERYRFPMYLSKMARSKGVRATKKGICLKLSAILHTSTSRISDDVLPMLKVMLKNDSELARSIADTIGAEAEEMAFLLDAKVDSDIVKSIITPAKVNAKKPDIIERQEEERDAPDEKSEVIKKEPPGTQKSLFQF